MKALTDPTPVIDQEQFESDRDVFMANAEEWRKEQNRKRSRKSAAKAKKTRQQEKESRRRVCEAKIAEAKELRSLGWSDVDICKQLHIGRDTLVRHLGPPQRKHTQKLPEAERREKQSQARQLLNRGFNYSQVAERVGVSKQSVRNWFPPEQRKAA